MAKKVKALSKSRRMDVVLLETMKKVERAKGYLKPQDLVEAARPTSSPIHSLFEWDEEKAAENYRKQQARLWIKHVKIQLIEGGPETNAYYSARVIINEKPIRGYFSAERVLSDENLASQVLNDAILEIKFWQKKYNDIESLKKVVDQEALKEIEAEVKS